MTVRETMNVVTVYNKPFFLNELLHAIKPEIITERVFDKMVEESSVFDLSTILTEMTRQVDISGLVPNFVGVYDDPQDVLEVLMTLGHTQLHKIGQLDIDLQGEVYETLKGSQHVTLRALLILDECQREVISHLNSIRKQSALAQALRKATEEALIDLYKRPEKLNSPIFDEVICFGDRESMYQGDPRICYLKRTEDRAVVEVWQFFIMPNIDKIRLPEPFRSHKVGHTLDKITPKIYHRRTSDDDLYNPRTPAGFMGLLGKVGGALPRAIAAQVKKNQHLQGQLMKDQEAATILYELFHH